MNLRDLRYLLAVAEHGHFGRAAEACSISQPTLSVQVRKLEELLEYCQVGGLWPVLTALAPNMTA